VVYQKRQKRPTPFRHERLKIAVPKDGVRLVVISDTHSNPHPKAVEHIRKLEPDHILHAGDVGNPAVLEDFRRIAPVIAVRGNIDARLPELPDAVTMILRGSDDSALYVLMVHIALRGPRLLKRTRELARREGASLIICGHSHVPFLGKEGGVIFNPGSIGPRRFALPITFGVLDVGPSGAIPRHFCCETGEEWKPPAP